MKHQTSNDSLLAGATVDPGVARILERSCQNCHSEKTEWPWYSYIAPLSWMIEHDVEAARERMNLSRWDGYSLDEQRWILTGMSAAIRNRQMPPRRYTLLHPAARLSDDELKQLYQWAQIERRRLRAMPESAHSSASANPGGVP